MLLALSETDWTHIENILGGVAVFLFLICWLVLD